MIAQVHVLRPDRAREAAALLAYGFAEEPGNVALFPDPDVRGRMLERTCPEYVRRALQHGSAHVATVGDELAAIALWDPPGVGGATVSGSLRLARDLLPAAPTMLRNARHLRATVLDSPRQTWNLGRVRSQAVAAASVGLTWHLAFLATAPEHRGKGLARALLERQLARCDEDGAAVWLETTDPANPPIYERFGFEVVEHLEDAAWLPGLWVMRREPQEPPSPS